jgi:YidC/Oxa1 family membrane protein insertase
MAEIENGVTTPDQPKRKKELPMELRLLLAFLLMGVVMFTTPYFFRAVSPPPPAGEPAASAEQAPTAPAADAPADPAPAAAAKAAPATPKSPTAAPAVSAEREEFHFLETDLYQITFSNRGGVVTSWLLKEHLAANREPLELVNSASKVDRPFALHFKNQKPSTDLNQALYAVKPDPDNLGVTFEYSDGNVQSRKSFQFEKRSYLSRMSAEVTEGGRTIPAWVSWRGGFGDLAVTGAASAGYSLHYDESNGKLVKNGHKEASDGPVSASGRFPFAGVEDTYFAAVFMPQENRSVDMVTFSDTVPTVVDQTEQPFAGSAVSDGASNEFSMYVGPKDLHTLRSFNHRLEQVVDFGWFAFLAKPLFLVVSWVTANFTHNYGWAIVLVTVVLNFLLFPLKIKSMKSMKKMQALAPQIKAIGEKYKGISIRDPRKAEQNQEVMGLYKKHGVNPMGGCMPMLLQIPFFIAFYKVFTVAVEMRGASWLWVTDLSQPEHLPIKILPIAMIVSQFAMQKMTPAAGMDPAQQRMMLFMPLVFGFLFYNFSSGLVLYYLTSNVVAIGQQWFFNRTSIAEALAKEIHAAAPSPKAASRKKNGRK